MKIAMYLALALCFSGCASLGGKINTPKELESAIYSHSTFHEDFLTCKERSRMAGRWLREHGYTYSVCGERSPERLHTFVRWFKDGESGDILRDKNGVEKWCTKPSKDYPHHSNPDYGVDFK